jgi:5-methylcytosine-specific restriction endonuclease McrA
MIMGNISHYDQINLLEDKIEFKKQIISKLNEKKEYSKEREKEVAITLRKFDNSVEILEIQREKIRTAKSSWKLWGMGHITDDAREKLRIVDNKISQLKKEKMLIGKKYDSFIWSEDCFSYKDEDEIKKTRQDIQKARQDIKKFKAETKELKVKERIKIDRSKIAAHERKSRDFADKFKKTIPKTGYCPYCGDDLGNNPHLDHIIPIAKGGYSIEPNLVYVCEDCNLKKSDMTLTKFIKKYYLDRDMVEENLDNLEKEY